MILNVSGRTDIINYYTPWFLNRLKEGYIYTRNPYNPKQLTKYDLSPRKVDAFIFCSKNYEEILEYMPMISRKYPIYCHYTITCYEKDVERKVPPIDESIETLQKLSKIIGSKKVSWRYDPILFTKKYDLDKHLEIFEYITKNLENYVASCIISFVDMYNKVYKNMPEILEFREEEKIEILTQLANIAKKHNIPLQGCAVANEYEKYGLKKSGCVTSQILEKSNNIVFKPVKHGRKRNGCFCIDWRDIGEYNTCLNECKYCYANKYPKIAKKKYYQHDVNSPLLIGHPKNDDIIKNAKQVSFLKIDNQQQTLI